MVVFDPLNFLGYSYTLRIPFGRKNLVRSLPQDMVNSVGGMLNRLSDKSLRHRNTVRGSKGHNFTVFERGGEEREGIIREDMCQCNPDVAVMELVVES